MTGCSKKKKRKKIVQEQEQEQEQAEPATTATATDIAPTGEKKKRKTALVEGQAAETPAAMSSDVSPAEPAATATENEPTIQAGACALLSWAARVLSGSREWPHSQAWSNSIRPMHRQVWCRWTASCQIKYAPYISCAVAAASKSRDAARCACRDSAVLTTWCARRHLTR